MDNTKLTPYQLTFYYEWLNNPSRIDYNIVIDNTLEGYIDFALLKNSFEKIINEHFITCYVVSNQIDNIVWTYQELPSDNIIYHGTPLTDKQIAELVSIPFDLEYDIRPRVHLINLGDDTYRMILVFHHITVDGISTEETWEKFRKNYNGIHYEVPSIKEQKQMHEVLRKSFETLMNQEKEQMVCFWKEHLKDVKNVDLSFLKPTQKPSDAFSIPLITEYLFSYDEQIGNQVKALRRKYKMTTYIFGQFVLALLLHKIAQQPDIPIIYPVAILEGKDLIYGAHVNTLLINYHFDKQTTLQSIMDGMLAYHKSLKKCSGKYLPIYELMDYVDNPNVLDIAFVQTFFRDHPSGLNGVTKDQVNHEFQVDLSNKLVFEQEEHNNCINYRVKFNKQLLDKTLVQQFVNLYQQLFVQVLNLLTNSQADILTHEVELLNQEDCHKLIYETNQATRRPYAKDNTVTQLFEKQVQQTPHNTAVIFNQTHLSYELLNKKSNQLAHYLKKHFNIHPNDFVGLYLDRSEHIIISILAVLKAGAAYVPMDPDVPNERNSFIIQDAHLKTVITQQHYQERLAGLAPELPIISIDKATFIQTVAQYPTENLITDATPHDLAYAIYTSGTTGNPKGTLIEHHNINRLVVNANFVKITESDRLLSISGYQFDASTYDIFAALLNGAGVVIATKDNLLNLELFNQLINEHKITNFFATTAFFNTLVDAELPNLAQLKYILAGGEALSAVHVNKFLVRYPHVNLVNGYGPTETTTFAVTYLANQAEVPFDYSVPIGVALSNTALYILNEQLRPVPMGAIGELYIGGAGVGRGYLNNPELTKKVFINNPFQTPEEKAEGYNDRIYKTGDLVRLLPDGNIEYFGRNDFQVKIRGFRIELSEIETRLASHPAIKQTLVLALDNNAGSKYLAAYYVSANEISPDTLYQYLQQYLPDYMMPAAFIHLTELPVNMNGKVDRRALPTPSLATTENYVAPSTTTEQLLADIYSEFLGIAREHISITDDFFRSGGNSIQAIKLAGKVTRVFDRAVNVTDIFTHRTIQALASFIEQSDAERIHIPQSNVSDPQQQLLSFAQERLWFIDSYEGGSSAYNIPLIFKVKDTTDFAVIKKAIQYIVSRHEVLHTLIKTNDKGLGYQQVIDLHTTPLVFNHVICENRENLDAKLHQHAHCIFKLDQEYPISINSYTLNSERYLSIIIHHIAFDGWSIDLFIKELAHYYGYFYALQSGNTQQAKAVELEPVEIQYKDFALWQRQYLQGKVLDQQLEYWQQQLADYEPLNLPTDYQRPLQIDYTGRDINFSLSKTLSQQLRALAAELNVSLYSVLLSGYYLLLSAFSNQKDIVVGTPIAGRHYQAIENTMGFFVNSLALRQQINPEHSLKEFIEQTGQLINNAQQYQDLPFEKLVDAIGVEIDASRHPIFQVMFGVQSFGSGKLQDIEQLLELYQTEHNIQQPAKFDITTLLDDSQETISGQFNYATRLFDEQTIKHYITVYQYILEQFATLCQQQKPIAKLQYLNKNLYQTLIYDRNKTQQPYAKDKTVALLFEDQVAKTPHNTAVIFNQTGLSYENLNKQANQLAHFLREEYQVQPNDFIGLYLDRSEQIVVSILAVLKAGAAYVPMDPDAPNERNGFIIQDAKLKAVITQAHYQSSLMELAPDVAVYCIDQEKFKQTLASYSIENPVIKAKPTDLAYSIYTSGTTGNPKGTLIKQYNINRLILNANYVDITASDHLLSISGYQFDASTYDIFGSLLNGASIVIATKDNFLNLDQFNQLIADYQITNFFATTAFFNTLVDAQLPNLAQLRYVLFGGEAVSAIHVNKFRACYPEVNLVHVYGPTETTTYATYYSTNQENKVFGHTVPIGKPLSNTTTYILNEQLQPVPIGAIGELYVGGAGVGNGYLNNPEMTNKAFINNPYQTDQEKAQDYNDKLYKTGDLVRYLADGNIEYISRNDSQVKIRGFRIELGEIEARLNSYPAIKQAVVLALINNTGAKYLAAYYVADEALSQDTLSQYLQAYLPEYMIPAVFMYLETLPMTMNGKVNHRVLPTPSFTNSKAYVAPTNETEAIFCKTFADVLSLQVENIGREDDFFKLGGDSISSIQLANRIRQALNYYLSIKDIFNHRTVRALSDYVLNSQHKSTPIIQSEPGVLTGEIPLAPIQQWFFQNINLGKLPDYEHWNQAFLIEVPQLNIDLLRLSAAKLVAYHDMLRATYQTPPASYYQPMNDHICFSHFNVKGLSDDQITEQLTQWQSHFSFKEGVLYHIGYLEGYADNSARIHIAAHHLNIDAVSWRIIKNDLQVLYQFFEKQAEQLDYTIDPEKILGAKGTSYRQWVNNQQNYPLVTVRGYENEQAYWSEVITDLDNYNQSLNSYRINTLNKTNICLSKEYTNRLLREVHKIYNTRINDVLLTALAHTLELVFNSHQNYILLEGHGREDLYPDMDVNNTVGWFTCMFPVKLSTVDNKNIVQHLPVIKDTLRAIPNNGLGYSILYGYTKQALPVICFNYLGQFDTDMQDQQWSFSNESSGLAVSINNRNTDFLSLNGGVLNGQLQFNAEGYLNNAQLEYFSAIFTQQLETLIDGVTQLDRGYLTSSDINHIISNELLDSLQKDHEIEAIYPANSLQQGFIYHAVSQGESDNAYRIQIIWDYHNTLQPELLNQALQHTQAKHPTLRVRFSWTEELIQIIDKQSSFNWTFIDLSERSPEEQQKTTKNLIAQDHQISYDLAQGHLFRVYLIKFAKDHYRCIFNNHHAILDGWSLPLLLNDVHQNYLALANNQPTRIQEDKSYLNAQTFLQSHIEKTHDFWQNYLIPSDSQETLEGLLKPEMRHVNLSEHKYVKEPQELEIIFDSKQCEQFKELCQTHGFTLNALMQYCWHQQLSLYNNIDTTTIGMTVSGRNLPIDGIETSIGLYINTLPVVLQHKDDSVVNIVKQLQEHINNVNNHSNINLIELQTSGERLFNSLFVFENYPISDSKDEQLQITFKEGKEKLDYPLGIVVFEKAGTVSFKIKYAGELFSQASIERLLQGISLTLTQLVNNPTIYAKKLQLLTANEYTQLITAQLQNTAPFIQNKLISQLFEDQVSRTPNNIALIYEDKQFTYKELNEYTNQLAHFLTSHFTIQADSLIGLYLDKSEHMLISILAVLKAGAAYVPMSPQAPFERIEFMMADTQAEIILTNQCYYDSLKSSAKDYIAEVIAVDNPSLIDQLVLQNSQNITPKSQANNLAYIIYTSGTTGQPKGVMIEHHTLANLATAQQDILELTTSHNQDDQKNVLWYSSYVFDAHAFEIYNALLNGHCLHILAEHKRLDFGALYTYIKDKAIDFAFIPPALLDKNDILPAPVLTVGGEAANAELVTQYCEQGVKLINVYGPSETTVWATSHTYQKDDLNTNIGQSIHNVHTYILDSYLRPVPAGVIGELYIGGAGVGRGYLNNPEMTDSVFISNPFQTAQEKLQNTYQRLYKTGDLARYLPNADIEYMGRNDFQVKIRGFRIELGEIETRLISHKAIKQAIVLALDNTVANKYLAAYYVADKLLTQEELINYLQLFLPDYMIPTAFVQLEALPLNINGKVDRYALPEPTLISQNQYVAPTTNTEQKVIEIISAFLGIATKNISIIDDFFKLGGNSILAIKLASHMTKTFAKPIHITDIFNYRTAKALAHFIDNTDAESISITAPIVTSPEQQLLSFAQERLWFIDCYEGGSNAYNIPLVLKVNNAIDLSLVEKAIKAVVTRHEILRTLIKTNQEGFGYQQVITLQDKPLVINQINCDSQETLNASIDKHIHRIFALSQEYPISINQYQLHNEYYMSIVIHHIAFDGWSVDILTKELSRYYHYFSTLAEGHTEQLKEVILPPLDVQYKDFALWQRQYLQGEVLAQQLQYWKQQLEGYEPLNLPTDYTRPLQIDYTGQDIGFQLDKALSQQLRELAAELNVSLYTVLLSGYYLLLSSFSNQYDIVIGTPIAGRHYPAIENTIGLFVNTLALRQQIDPNSSLKEFIQKTGQLAYEAQKYQDLPFEKLVDAMQVEKDASRHPIFQVMFGLQSFGSDINHSEQLFEPYQSEQAQYQTAKFDITTLLDDSKESITGILNFAPHLFNKTTIQRYIKVYQCILKQFSTLCEKQQPINQLQYLDQENYQATIIDWNQTQRDFPQEATIHGLFEAQVLKTPNNIAMLYQNDRLTYKELNEHANRLAHYLRDKLAIQPDDLVALCLERSQYMLISILATLKAGGAYVPMDPQAPEDRISYMINNAEAKVILTTNSSYEKVKALANTNQTVINLQTNTIQHELTNYSHQNPTALAKPHNLAYVIYTSGTTGNPKGVMLEHYGVINRIVWMHEQYPITEQDHILQKTNYTFDVSVWELFWANWYGACIVFAHPELYKDNVYLANLIYDEQITVLHFVPSMLLAFVETLDSQSELQSKVQGLRYLFCSGEALNAYEVTKCHHLMPNCEIHNLYGPTEASIDVLYYDCNIPNIRDVLIGKPIANTSAYVLNNSLQPVPIGGIGELHVGGVGVARGYLNNPSLTAEKFITNPFQSEQEKQRCYNNRIYKTGDLVRALPDGNIQYLGRNDFQIKIRGFRVELGEIEICLTQYPTINHTVVIAYEQASGNKYLVAYYVAPQEIDAQLLQAHLHQILPDHMVPSAFIHLSELPITSNGKLDRRALPKPELTNTVAYIAPQTPIEIALCNVLAKTLNISMSDISMEDNFFKLGGNSILAMILNNRINETLNVKLRLLDILTPRTIRELSIRITHAKEQFNPIVELNKALDKPPMFMIHPGIGGCDVYAPLANKLSEHYHCYGVDSYNLYHEEKIDNLYTLSQYYLNAINALFNKEEPITLLGWSLGGQIALEIAANLEAMGVKNITVHLLDTWLLHKEDTTSDCHLVDLTYAMKELNIPSHLQSKIERIAEVDNKLVIQPLSAKLKEVHILLFKAMKTTDDEHSKQLHQKYPLNNIDSCITSSDQLQLVEMDVNHYKILEKEKELISYIADPVI